MANRNDGERSRLDDAARAGWLYYVAGNTQDEIARKLGVSRQSAQRLVSLAVSEKLIKVRLDHPIANCMELAERLKRRFELQACEIVPSDPSSPSSIVGIALAGAAEMERHLKAQAPKIIAMGTGRSLRACVEQLPPMDCPQHRIVSLLGNMMPDGSASPYNVVIRMADRAGARHFPMSLPAFARSPEERDVLQAQGQVHNTMELARHADVTFVGVGQLGAEAPVLIDGFVTHEELRALEKSGAVGEITSWAYDAEGRLINGLTNERVLGTLLSPGQTNPVVGIAVSEAKVSAILGALRGKLLNRLITDELTAELLLKK